jgi:enolase
MLHANDGSEHAFHALALALLIAKQDNSELHMVSVEEIRRGIEQRATNAVLIKLNQIGTVTETIEAIEMCRSAGWRFIVSHRSGETEDAIISDFAVAMGGGQMKTGSLCRSERWLRGAASGKHLCAGVGRAVGANGHPIGGCVQIF